VFIDDITSNVVAAQDAGLAAIHHRSAAQTRTELSELLDISLTERPALS